MILHFQIIFHFHFIIFIFIFICYQFQQATLHNKIHELESDIAQRSSSMSSKCDCNMDSSSAIESRLHEVEKINKQLKEALHELHLQLTDQVNPLTPQI
jgi:translation initiation factor 2B subunit (eIF-2B alpha/beta/delta family)